METLTFFALSDFHDGGHYNELTGLEENDTGSNYPSIPIAQDHPTPYEE